jgi:hypothetical protein
VQSLHCDGVAQSIVAMGGRALPFSPSIRDLDSQSAVPSISVVQWVDRHNGAPGRLWTREVRDNRDDQIRGG